MLVLMDLEWIETRDRICPTQLSAVWTDENWKAVSRIDLTIRPFDSSAEKWNHVAYTGHQPADFIYGFTAAQAMNTLLRRLSPMDVLCWWSLPTAETFIALYRLFMKEAPANRICLIAPALAEPLSKAGIPARGSAYVLSEKLGLQISGEEHCSTNDVNVIQGLLRLLDVRQEAVVSCPVPGNSLCKTVREIHRRPYSSDRCRSHKNPAAKETGRWVCRCRSPRPAHARPEQCFLQSPQRICLWGGLSLPRPIPPR